MQIKVVPLGAGQDVGRSCILLTIGGKNIMFDCGMHMGYNDERRFPDFSYISKEEKFTELIDCLIVSHFHLDHCGALPYFTEMCGYFGPIYMTHPTKAISPILLEDYRKITVEKKGETNFFTSEMIKNCMKKVIPVNIHQTIKVDDELEIKAYYAGHVLGAAMFYVRVGNESAVYTGDYNMTPDRHLGSAWIDKLRPDVLITETTYATTIRDSKRARERDFLKKVHDCVAKGGKVLIPVFALGRAQELCILIDTYWERMNLKVPVYFSAGLTEKANNYYQLFINWTNQKIKNTFVKRNMFDFKHIKSFDRSFMDDAGPMVLFATPGMLHSGTSLDVFKKWAPSEKNMLIMPGYCVAGTVGAKVLAGQKIIEIDKKTVIEVKMQIKNLSFSAHADAKGIMQLIRQCEPRNVVLVHGEKAKMGFLKQKIMKEFSVPCYDPGNGMTVSFPTSQAMPVDLSSSLLKNVLQSNVFNNNDEQDYSKEPLEKSQREILGKRTLREAGLEEEDGQGQRQRLDGGIDENDEDFFGNGDEDNDYHLDEQIRKKRSKSKMPIQGFLVIKENQPLRVVEPSELSAHIGAQPHQLSFQLEKTFVPSNIPQIRDQLTNLNSTSSTSVSASKSDLNLGTPLRNFLVKELRNWLSQIASVEEKGEEIHINSIKIKLDGVNSDGITWKLLISWAYLDEDLGLRTLSIVDNCLKLDSAS